MMPPLLFYQLVLLGLLWLFIILHYAWPSRSVREGQRPSTPLTPRRKRSNEPTPFVELTHKPHYTLREQEATQPKLLPPTRPAPMPPTTRRPRVIDNSMHFCPHTGCAYRSWVGLGNLRTNGHPSGDL